LDNSDSSAETYTASAPNSIQIGSRVAAGYYFDGKIDDFKIYDYARTAAQIMVDYNAGMATHTGTGADPNEGNAAVGYWKFDENTGTNAYDRSGSGNDGAITGATWAQGQHGSALDFNGTTNFVNCGNDSSLQLDTGGTIQAWIKIDELDSGYDNTIIMKGDGASWANLHYIIFENSGTNKILLSVSDGTTPLSTSGPETSALSPDTWYHVVATWGSTYKRIYLNGELQETVESSIMPKNTMTSCQVDIGMSYPNSYYFDGLIDEVKIYDYVRTAAQITYDYNKGRPVAHYKFDEGTGSIAHNSESSAYSGAAPVGWWRMDESSWNGTADEVTDSSGNGNDGVRVATATTSSSSKVGPYCGTFDGDSDYVNCGNDDSLDFPTNDFTLEAWVNMTAGANILLRKGGGYSTGAPGYSIAGGASSILQISGTTAVIYNANPGGTLATGAWNHLAYSVDRDGYVKKYINYGTSVLQVAP